jgi:hypothetical protein
VWRKLTEVAELEAPCLNWLTFGLQVTITLSETVQYIPKRGVQSWNASWGKTQSMIIKKSALGCLDLQSGRGKSQIKWHHIPEHRNIHFITAERTLNLT